MKHTAFLQVAKVDETISGGGKSRRPLAEHFRRLVCFCRLTEVPDLKAASSSNKDGTKHQRGVFLFNDVLVVTKSVAMSSKASKASKARHQYRLALQLADLRVNVFSISQYQFGLQLQDR